MKRRTRRISWTLVLGLTLSTTALAVPGSASPQDNLAAKKARAAEIEAQLADQHHREEMLNEEYLQAKAAADDAAARIESAEHGIAMAEEASSHLRGLLAGRAARLYIGAGTGDPLGLDADDVRSLGAKSRYSRAAAESDNRMLDDLLLANERLQDQRDLAEDVRRDAEGRRKDADAALAELQSTISETERMLASLEGEIRDLVDQIAEEKRRADEARARAEFERLQQQRNAQPAQTANDGVATGRDPSSVGVVPFDAPAPSAGAAKAVAYAWEQLGKPYRYAGVGPDAYDCSGLTMMAWAQAGVGMPHGSIAQGNMFPRVPNDQLAPGDLIIYYPDHGHVGIYVGNGQTISATHTGDFVRLQPVFRSGFQFGVRPG
jgi:cell wall-associated NlpC family hydrolase